MQPQYMVYPGTRRLPHPAIVRRTVTHDRRGPSHHDQVQRAPEQKEATLMTEPHTMIDDMLRIYPELDTISVTLNYRRHPCYSDDFTEVIITVHAQTMNSSVTSIMAPITTLENHGYMLQEAITSLARLFAIADMLQDLSKRRTEAP